MNITSKSPWLNPRYAHRQYLQDLWYQAALEHLLCLQPKCLLYELLGRAKWDDQLVRLARVRFKRNRFEFDKNGRWAFVAPVFDGSEPFDFAAFAVGDDRLRAPFVSAITAVGLDDALFEANRNDDRAIDLHYSPIAWILSGCCGALPVSWRRMAAFLVNDCFAPRAFFKEDGERAEEALHLNRRLPRMRIRHGDNP